MDSEGHLLLFGNWSIFRSVAGHAAFAGLVALFEQDHQAGSRAVRADQFDRIVVWAEMVRAARETAALA